jgi:hypothetical protein
MKRYMFDKTHARVQFHVPTDAKGRGMYNFYIQKFTMLREMPSDCAIRSEVKRRLGAQEAGPLARRLRFSIDCPRSARGRFSVGADGGRNGAPKTNQ